MKPVCCFPALFLLSGSLFDFGSIAIGVNVSCVGLYCDFSLVNGNADFLIAWFCGEGDEDEVCDGIAVERYPLFASAS